MTGILNDSVFLPDLGRSTEETPDDPGSGEHDNVRIQHDEKDDLGQRMKLMRGLHRLQVPSLVWVATAYLTPRSLGEAGE